MNSFKLALFNIKNNLQLYRFNLLSMVFGIAMFYNFVALIFNPSLALLSADDLLIQATLYMTTILLVFFITFFILYSNSFFLKQRKRETGIYIFLGVDNRQLALVFAIEEILQGLIALCLGLVSGVIFQKAFLMLLTRLGSFKTEITFHLSLAALLISGFIFVGVFSLAGLIGFLSIASSKLIDLLNAEKHEDQYLSTRFFSGILSIVLIGVGLYFTQYLFSDAFLIYGSAVMLCFIFGTFLFFYSFLSIVIRFFCQQKGILYRGANIISISNLAYRVKYNYRTLAIITLIVAATITAIGSAISIQHIFDSTIQIAYPFSFTFISSDPQVKQEVLSVVQNSNHRVLINLQTPYLLFDSQKNSLGEKNYPVIKMTDFIRIAGALDIQHKETIIQEAQAIQDGTALSAVSSNDRGFRNNQALSMYGLNIHIKRTINIPLLGTRFENNTIILTDNDYAKFKEYCGNLADPEKERVFNGILVSDQEGSLALSEELAAIPALKKNLNSFIVYFNAYNEVTGVVKFTGIFLGLVFMISTACIMYMKLLSDAIGDKRQYEILIKLGITDQELFSAVARQIGLSYAFPLLVGAVYAFMALNALQSFLNHYFEISLLGPFLISVGIFSTVYFIFYLFTTRKFISLVKLPI